MPRKRAPFAAVLLLAAGAAAAPPPPPKFRPFNGVSPDQFYQSSVARSAEQLAQELAALKGDAAAAPLAPPAAQTLTTLANQAAANASELARTARTAGDRGRITRSLAAVTASVTTLQKTIPATPNVTPAVAERLARVSAAYQQLAVAVAGSDPAAPDQGKVVVARLAEALDHEAGGLRLTVVRFGKGFGQPAEATCARFAAAARKLHTDLDKTGDLNRARADFGAVAAGWADAARVLAAVPNLPPEVRNQAARTDGAYRKLAAAVGPPVQPGVPLQPPPAYSPQALPVLAVGAGEGGGPRVRVFHDPKGPPVFDFFAYDPAFRGGVRVAVADVNGDGVPDVVTAPGAGTAPALVRVFDGRDMSLLVEFQGWDASWSGGLNVAAADLTADGRALVALAPDVGGGPVARVFDLAVGKEVATITAYPGDLRGGLRLAFGDVNNDGVPELLTAPGPCPHPPVVKVFDLATRRPVSEFAAADPAWAGGVWVAAHGGSVLCGTDAGSPPVVRAFNGINGQKVGEWAAFPPGFAGGVRVAVVDARVPGQVNFVCAAGGGAPGSPVRVFSGRGAQLIAEFRAFTDFAGGSFVAGR